MGSLSVNNLKKAINNSRKISLDKLIYSVGIRHIGQENAKIIADFYGSIEKFKKIFTKNYRKKNIVNLLELDGIGETQVDSLDSFFSNETNLRILKDLIHELKLKIILPIKDGIFKIKNYVSVI